jgi:hypothetical protein
MMEKPTAYTGWLWFREGLVLFRKRPLELATLFLCYIFLMLLVGIVPVAGKLLPMMLMPTFSIGFMQACVNIEQGKRVYPTLLLAGFRSPALPTLLILGVLYLGSALLALAASALIDGGVFRDAITGQIEVDQNTVQQSHMTGAMFFAMLVYAPAAMAFWYAAPLAAWQEMKAGKAIFYSFFAVLRAGKAFLAYMLVWFMVAAVLVPMFASVVAWLTGQIGIARLVLVPISILLFILVYCSSYATYTTVFGRPEPLPAIDPEIDPEI